MKPEVYAVPPSRLADVVFWTSATAEASATLAGRIEILPSKRLTPVLRSIERPPVCGRARCYPATSGLRLAGRPRARVPGRRRETEGGSAHEKGRGAPALRAVPHPPCPSRLHEAPEILDEDS